MGDGTIFALFGLGSYVTAVVVAIVGWAKLRRRDASIDRDFHPRVSIFKPLAGVDDGLEDNLESFASLDYPDFELLLCANHAEDPALVVAERVRARHPDRCIHVLVSHSEATNPKIANCESMASVATGELWLLSDSDVRIQPDDLSRLVQPFADPQVGMVYQPVIALGEQTLGATVENMRWNEFPGLMTVAAKTFANADVVVGKGQLCRRSAMESIDCFAPVRDVCAEDFLISRSLKQAGWKLALSPVLAVTRHTRVPLARAFKRHARHASMRWNIEPWGFMFEPLLNPVMIALLPLLFGGVRGAAVFAGITLTKILVETACVSTLLGRRMPWYQILLIPFKDLVMFGVWLSGMCNNRVYWRGKEYRMTRGSRITLLQPEPISTLAETSA